MSITQETLQKHLKDPAIFCCRREKGLVIGAADLEDPGLFDDMTVQIVQPGEHNFFVNSNLDYMPIACKTRGSLGEGETNLLTGVTVMGMLQENR